MILVDSSAWIDLLSEGDFSVSIQREIDQRKPVVVPTLVLFEVYRKLLSVSLESDALTAIVALSRHAVVDLTRDIALLAGDISIQEKLAMADSIVLATARAYRAPLLTLDNDFAQIHDVKVLRN